mmetsp:Transcript_3035/g.4452  ORF Transcript_3035/g.4452 Transcript_3035/m.4452 type:complete len:603 (+) Transcript_3035:38-1846(+)
MPKEQPKDEYDKIGSSKVDQAQQTEEGAEISTTDINIDSIEGTKNEKKGNKIVNFFKHLFIFFQFPFVANVIILVELIERFAFYGFKAILVLYISEELNFGDEYSKIVTHAFIVTAYFTPILGSAFADSKVGRFWTIFVLTIVYAIGEAIITLSAFLPKSGEPDDKQWVKLAVSIVGLFFSGLGTGGIKPNVSTYGADQIDEDDKDLKTSFFSMFYFSINLGSTVSTILLPILKQYIGYGWSFLIPAVSIAVVALIFGIFKRKYKNRDIRDTIVLNVIVIVFWGVISTIYNFFYTLVRCTWHKYLKGLFFCFCPSRLDDASYQIPNLVDDVPNWTKRYTKRQVADVKKAIKIATCMVFVPVFWALYDQHASTWVLQAKRMNKSFFWDIQLPPDAIQASNPIFILLLVPIFDRIVYPLITKCKIKLTPMRKLGAGLVILFVSFAVSWIIEFALMINKQHHPDQVEPPLYLHMFLLLPQNFLLCMAEVLFSITGLEFAYDEAPSSMKSIMSAVWLLYISAGNLIVVFVSFCVVVPLENTIGDWIHVFSISIYLALTLLNIVLFVFISIWWGEQKRFYAKLEEDSNAVMEDTPIELSQNNEEGEI